MGPVQATGRRLPTVSAMAEAQRTARAGPSNVARNPSPRCAHRRSSHIGFPAGPSRPPKLTRLKLTDVNGDAADIVAHDLTLASVPRQSDNARAGCATGIPDAGIPALSRGTHQAGTSAVSSPGKIRPRILHQPIAASSASFVPAPQRVAHTLIASSVAVCRGRRPARSPERCCFRRTGVGELGKPRS